MTLESVKYSNFFVVQLYMYVLYYLEHLEIFKVINWINRFLAIRNIRIRIWKCQTKSEEKMSLTFTKYLLHSKY